MAFRTVARLEPGARDTQVLLPFPLQAETGQIDPDGAQEHAETLVAEPAGQLPGVRLGQDDDLREPAGVHRQLPGMEQRPVRFRGLRRHREHDDGSPPGGIGQHPGELGDGRRRVQHPGADGDGFAGLPQPEAGGELREGVGNARLEILRRGLSHEKDPRPHRRRRPRGDFAADLGDPLGASAAGVRLTQAERPVVPFRPLGPDRLAAPRAPHGREARLFESFGRQRAPQLEGRPIEERRAAGVRRLGAVRQLGADAEDLVLTGSGEVGTAGRGRRGERGARHDDP